MFSFLSFKEIEKWFRDWCCWDDENLDTTYGDAIASYIQDK